MLFKEPNISFKQKEIKEESREEIFNTYIFNAYLNNEFAGYAKLSYIPEEKAKKIKSTMSYFIYKNYGSDKTIINAYKNKDYETILKKLYNKYDSSNKDIKETFLKFEEEITNSFFKQHQKFFDYWVNKPTLDLIRVFDEKDTKVTDFIQEETIYREAKNFKRQGVGLAIYSHIAEFCKQKNLKLWASQVQTEDAKTIWEKMEKHPKFLVLMQYSIEKSINHSNKSTSRKTLTIN